MAERQRLADLERAYRLLGPLVRDEYGWGVEPLSDVIRDLQPMYHPADGITPEDIAALRRLEGPAGEG